MMESLVTSAPEVGALIDRRYRLIKKIGEGGMGAVFEAEDIRTGRLLALKMMIFGERHCHDESVKRFLAEARAVGALDSPHVVKVYDVGSDADRIAHGIQLPYIAMELLVGEDCGALLAREQALEPVAAARLVAQAAKGLAMAHERHVIHRDVKPGNLFLVPQSDGGVIVKVVDFGIAKVRRELGGTDNVGLTKSGNVVGTPMYMSPEQAVGLKNVDQRSDVWSLGIVLYTALAGVEPFEGADTLGKLIITIYSTAVPPLQQRAPWVSPELAAVVHRALERAPDARYASAGEMYGALLNCCGGDNRLRADLLVSVCDATRSAVQPKLKLEVSSEPAFSPADIESLLASPSALRDPRLSTLSDDVPAADAVRTVAEVDGVDSTDAALAQAAEGELDDADTIATVNRSSSDGAPMALAVSTAQGQGAVDVSPPLRGGLESVASTRRAVFMAVLAVGLVTLAVILWRPWISRNDPLPATVASNDPPGAPPGDEPDPSRSVDADAAPSQHPAGGGAGGGSAGGTELGTTATAAAPKTTTAPTTTATRNATTPTTSAPTPATKTTTTKPKTVDCVKNPFTVDAKGYKVLRKECGG